MSDEVDIYKAYTDLVDDLIKAQDRVAELEAEIKQRDYETAKTIVNMYDMPHMRARLKESKQ